jgi:hypothetical protein
VSAPVVATPLIAEIRGYRRTGHAVVSVSRRGRTRRYRVSLARFFWLRFWLIILCPWRSGGSSSSSSFETTVSASERDFGTPEFRRAQWRDFHRRNWKRLPRRTRTPLQKVSP